MSLLGLLTQPLTVQNRTQQGNDGFNDLAWVADGDPFTVTGKLRITTTTESLDDRDVVVTTRKAILPAGTNINAYALVSFLGVTWEVDGDPRPIWNPRTAQVAYLECMLTETTGG